MSVTQQDKFERFKALHEGPGIFVMPNPWNAGSARILTELGYEALATTSAGFAFAIGRRDSTASISREEILANAREIVDATDLPVSADLEDGFGLSPDSCAQTIKEACQVGLVGGSIEDASNDRVAPIIEFNLAVERVAAACEAARGLPFLVTARAENYLYKRPDLEDTIARLQAFSKAGADVLYAPGLTDLNSIRQVCEAVDKPVNVVMGLAGKPFSVSDLEAAGVRRISVGGSFARAALGAFFRAAEEVKNHGTFTYAADAMPDRVANGYMPKPPAQ
ncbi:isocitrate lyase/PEP mutase family protein [Rhodovibrionaceae bacterium A322]